MNAKRSSLSINHHVKIQFVDFLNFLEFYNKFGLTNFNLKEFFQQGIHPASEPAVNLMTNFSRMESGSRVAS